MVKKILWLNDEKATARILFLTLSLLFSVVLIARQLSQTGHLIASDGVGYFVHLPSMLIDGDINYADDFAAFDRRGRNHWPVGCAIAWLPFYLIGHLVSLSGSALGVGWITDGTGFSEQLACCIGTIVYGSAAVALTYRLCCRWFQPRWACLGVMLFFAGSNLPYYLLAEPYMSHGVAAFWTALLLYFGLSPTPLSAKKAALIGVIAGLSALTRPQDGLLIAVPLLYHLPTSSGRFLRAVGISGFVSFLVFAPQIAIWQDGLARQQSGPRQHKKVPSPQRTSPKLSSQTPPVAEQASHARKPKPRGIERKSRIVPGGLLDWTSPKLYNELLGRHHGLLTWHPLYLLAFGGLLGMLFRYPKPALVALVGVLIHTYIVGVWAGQGQTFGGRMFVSCFSLFALGLTSLLEDWKKIRIPVTLASLLSIAWNLVLMVRFRQLINSGTQVTFDKMLDF